MLALVMEWGPLVLLVTLQWLLRRFIANVYLRLKRRIDDKIPDDLPIGGRDWLDEQLRARGLEDTIQVFDGKHQNDVDAFFPTARMIILSAEVQRKRDPSFWAVAGHELGHALVHGCSRAVGFFFSLGRVLTYTCTRTATLLIFANILYVRREIDDIAFALLTVSLAGYVVVLIDEALASALSLRMLARDERVGRRGFVGAVTALAAAFMTYAGGFVGQILLLLNRERVVEQIHRHREPVLAPPMGAARLAIVGVLAAILLVLAIRATVDAVRKSDKAMGGLRLLFETFVRTFLGVTIVALVWDQPLGKWFPLVCVAGLLASSGFLMLVAKLAELIVRVTVFIVVAIPAYFVVYVVTYFFGHLFHDAIERTEEDKPPMSKRTAAEHDRLRAVLDANPSWYARARKLAFPLLHVGFVVALSVSVAMR